MFLGLAKPNAANDADYQETEDDYAYEDEDENKSGQDRSNKESNNIIVTPYFESTEYQTTVKIGDTAVLECNLKNYGCKKLIIYIQLL